MGSRRKQSERGEERFETWGGEREKKKTSKRRREELLVQSKASRYTVGGVWIFVTKRMEIDRPPCRLAAEASKEPGRRITADLLPWLLCWCCV